MSKDDTFTKNDSILAFAVTSDTPKIRFLASLSDGRTVVEDHRPNKRHAWIRLTKWLKENPDISITCVRLQGPNNIDIATPPDQQGYFLGRRLQCVWGGPQSSCIGIGYYDGQKVNVNWYRQPLFDSSFAEERTVVNSGFFLIKNP